MKAPIVLFVYNRPEHTLQVLEALNKCIGAEETELYIFSDGHKGDADHEKVNQVRNLVSTFQFVGRKKVMESEKNLGLYASVIQGINNIFERHDRVIVLEDDLIVDPDFLAFMQHYLTVYSNDSSVVQISGYLFGNLGIEIEYPFLMNLSTTWGWATWKEKWNAFKFGEYSLIDRIWLYLNQREFNLDNSYDYYKMFKKNRRNEIQSWGIEFRYHSFRSKSMILYPPYSLVSNIGLDNSGTHSGSESRVTIENKSGELIVSKENIHDQDYILKTISKKLKNNEAIFV